jgi:leucyl-tRNA synthetase
MFYAMIGANFMEEKYFAEVIEEKWQKIWAEKGTFHAEIDHTRPKFFALEMLPYPSGNLHMGHVRNYSIGDALAWYKRLKGFNVLHPIGWDSFGQPAEAAAIKRGVNPRDWTETNIEHMNGQLKRLGLSYDWRRQIFAHRPDYYKFDQWFFLKMFEKGLAYKKATQVNWCPSCETTLSNEQASGGICWRCGSATTKTDLNQWFFKITDYADQLLDDMQEIEAGWAEKVLKRQKDWIGRSEGAFVEFKVQSSELNVKVFTTRIDTIYGANAIVVAAEHPIIEANFASFPADVRAKIEEIRAEKLKVVDREVEVEKDGIDVGLKAVNPFSGEEIPVWVGNYVMMEYGTGAVMSVPGHDERDFEFAQKFKLPIRQVVIQNLKDEAVNVVNEAFTEYGFVVNSAEWNGKSTADAKRRMTEFATSKGFGEAATTYRLRDWGVSRQRFWGSPIPIIYCDSCGVVPEKYENLPVELPETAPFTGVGESPLAKVPEFVNVACPNCSKHAKRETDTMDTFVDSCWYYFRYCDSQNAELPFSQEVADYWLPVDQYIGGDDHAVMHLIYTRFWTKMMRDLGLVKFNEPVKRLLTQGMVIGETFFDDETGKKIYFPPNVVSVKRDEKGKLISATNVEGKNLKTAVERMSKSKGNGVDPDEMVEIYGADASRLFVLFAAPAENELLWKEEGVEGTKRFLQRVYRFVWKWKARLQDPTLHISRRYESQALDLLDISTDAKKLRRKTHQTIQRIEESFETLQFNTPVAALMELSNALGDWKIEPSQATAGDLFAIREGLEALILMLAPFAPHFAEEMYSMLVGNDNGILANGGKFPEFNASLAKSEEIEIPIQINGKLRSKVIASPETPNAELEKMALADEKVKEWTDGKEIVKIIVVPKRLVNIVVK